MEEKDEDVFSTYVEMILNLDGQLLNGGSILHVCGDDPLVLPPVTNRGGVFSTYVEMILTSDMSPSLTIQYSPRMWR